MTGTPQSREAYGRMVRKGDAAMTTTGDEAIAQSQASGQMAAICQKRFNAPIPPKGLNLDFALSKDMKALFAKPNAVIPE